MSLNKMSLTTVIKNQFFSKLTLYAGVFTSFVILQVFAILLSMGSMGGGISSSGGLEISYTTYSIAPVIIFTFLWGGIQAIKMSTKVNWEKSFMFVGNRFTHDLSNMIFLLVMSLIGGVLTVLTDFLFRVLTYYFLTDRTLAVNAFALTADEIFSGLISISFYLLLFSALGYLIGTVTRLHQMVSILLPAIFIGGIIAIIKTRSNVLVLISQFYFNETNLGLFITKIVVSVFILFFASILISSRTEVRRWLL